MGFDYVDLIYACWPPPGLSAEEIVDAVAGLLRAGKARAWGFVNWEPALLVEACALARVKGVSLPVAAQLPYSVAFPDALEGEAEQAALADSGAGVVASFALAGGALSGKYSRGGSGRRSGEVDDPDRRDAIACGERLTDLAADSGTTAAALALAFALCGPGVASVLFGAMSAEQVRENARALDLDAELIAAVRALSRETVRRSRSA